ncbi:MAG: type II secretion system F family protein [Pseudobdellovibrionaceae bacterium]
MTAFLANDWLMIIAVAACVFMVVYMWESRFVGYMQRKSLGNREEILRLLDLMFVEVDSKKVTILLLLLSFGLGAAVFLLLLPNVALAIMIGLMVTIAGWSAPLVAVKIVYDRRCNFFVDQMVDGLTIMANGIKSGLSVNQSMERVVENLGNPISQEFGLVLSQIRIGRSVEEALIEMGERIPRPDVQMFVTSINILKETGGNLAETFSTICTTIRERQKIEKKIQAMTAQGLTQGIIITLVPIVLLLVFSLVNPGYIKPLFNTTFGLIIIFIMFALQITGGIMIRKIVKIKV